MPCSGARAPRSLGTHPPKKVPTFADYLVFGGAAVDGAPGTFPQVILTRHADLPAVGAFEPTARVHSFFTTRPPFMTNFTCSSSLRSCNGSPDTAIRSANFLGSIAPIR